MKTVMHLHLMAVNMLESDSSFTVIYPTCSCSGWKEHKEKPPLCSAAVESDRVHRGRHRGSFCSEDNEFPE